MKLRIEFTKSRSPNFQNVVRICKKFDTFKEFQEEGMTIYSVEFEKIDPFIVIYDFIKKWDSPTYYVNDALTPESKLYEIMYPRTESKNTGPIQISANIGKFKKIYDEIYNSLPANMHDELKKIIVKNKMRNMKFVEMKNGEGKDI